ncbi:hypothetical protein AAZX31_15G246600 [Glycine max]|uniref:NAC domain-containing protein n=2 Tax=Glycine subgen. Soja TaxID=1462606 RepID=K7ME20_SOYBN|nr:NAC domain-containing protein 86 [Glycine max]XP_028203662.1 NAC domain-containing protein 86-like [Glycine soja]KAG5106902.1 hypothetical protein JHK82_043872 [Glycine max]KAG5117827.1 hypothetical protein JHK84_043940 [Glycine max]KAH1148943.1 hypothetical protein GYH30_043536 [Glycine max]KAH1211005.1 NAC domain-containing protein 86 [Glycine max]KHN48855.1 NAC domain-containing protein 78 [Glycine soja]|eukprot:XP_003546832.1 NAC domain-containing protein 86 [Glycine max]
MAPMSLPPGFRFHPTDEELVAYYLERKITGRSIELDIIAEVDLYKCEPWDLPDKSFLPSKDMEWYFYSPRDRKYPNGSRTNRATQAGYWKATGKDRPVHSQKKQVGMKKTLVYYRGRAPHGIRTNWVMHEYRLIESVPGATLSSLKDSYSLCRIFKKTIQIPAKTNNKEEEQVENAKKESMWISEEQMLGEDSSGTEISREMEAVDEKILNHEHPKFPCDASSSDLTQGTCTPTDTGIAEDFQPQFACDEANSAANSYTMGIGYPTNLFQDVQIPSYAGMHYQLPYTPLVMEDFPQINLPETKITKPEVTDDCMLYDRYRDCMNGTLEEIISLCCTQDNSVPFPMLE